MDLTISEKIEELKYKQARFNYFLSLLNYEVVTKKNHAYQLSLEAEIEKMIGAELPGGGTLITPPPVGSIVTAA